MSAPGFLLSFKFLLLVVWRFCLWFLSLLSFFGKLCLFYSECLSLVSCGFSLVVAFLSKHPSFTSSLKAAVSEQIKLLAANDSFVRQDANRKHKYENTFAHNVFVCKKITKISKKKKKNAFLSNFKSILLLHKSCGKVCFHNQVFVEAQCPKQTDSKSRVTPGRKKNYLFQLFETNFLKKMYSWSEKFPNWELEW